MADLNEMFAALEAADKAGNTEDAQQIAEMIQQFRGVPMAPAKPKAETEGFVPALKSSAQQLKADAARLAGRAGIISIPEAEKISAEAEKEAKGLFTPTAQGWTEAPWLKFKELAGQSLPYMVAPVVAGGAAAVAAPEALIAGGLLTAAELAAGVVGVAQFTGSNISRQVDEGTALANTNLLNAGLAAVPQAALDIWGLKMVPGIRQIFKQAGKEITEQTAKEVANTGLLSVLGSYAKQGIKTGTAEGLNEAGQQVFERLQAGLSLTDEKARSEYYDNFLGGAILGAAISVPGRALERSGKKAPTGEVVPTEGTPETPIVPTNVTPDMPVTGAGLAPVGQPPIPEVPPTFQPPTGIPTKPAQPAPPVGEPPIQPPPVEPIPGEAPPVTPPTTGPIETPPAPPRVEPITGFHIPTGTIEDVKDLGEHPGLGHEFILEKPSAGKALEGKLHLEKSFELPSSPSEMKLGELADKIDEIQGVKEGERSFKNQIMEIAQKSVPDIVEKLPARLKDAITNARQDVDNTSTPEYQEAQQEINRRVNELGQQFIRTRLQELGYDSIKYGTQVDGKPTTGIIALDLRKALGGERVPPTGAVPQPVTPTTPGVEKPNYRIDKSTQQIHSEIKGLKDHVELAKWAVDNAPNSFAREIAKKVYERMKGFRDELKIPMTLDIRDNSRIPKGWYGRSSWNPQFGGSLTIALAGLRNGNPVSNTGTRYSTILHELVHAASQVQLGTLGKYNKKWGLDKDHLSPAYKDLTKLLTQIRKQVREDSQKPDRHEAVNRIMSGWEYTKNADELLAYGLSDEVFQNYLSTVKIGNKSAYSKLIDVIRKVLNLSHDYDSALDSLMRATDKVFEPSVMDINEATRKAGLAWGRTGRIGPIATKSTAEPIGEVADENATANRLVKTTPVSTYGQTIKETALKTYKNIQDDTFRTGLRVNWIDKNSGVAKSLADQPIFNTSGQLRADMLLRSQDQMVNLIRNGLQTGSPDVNSDGTIVINRSENNLARSQIIADKLDDRMTFEGQKMSGRLGVATVARILRGKDIMEEDKARRNLGRRQLAYAKQLMADLKEARDEGAPISEIRRLVNDIKILRREGYKNAKTVRELQVSPADIKWAEEQVDNIPEVKEILGIWKNVNDSLVTLWEKAGLLTKEQADNYRAKDNYVPLFKSRDDLEGREGTYAGRGGAKTVKEMKQLRGSYAARNIWENIDKHYAGMVAAAYQNQTRKIATQQLQSVGAAEYVKADNPKANLRYRDPTSEHADSNGIVSAIIDNPNDLAAFQMMHYELGPIMKLFSKSTQVLRATALINPMFWVKQLIRDPIHASLVANSGIVTPFHSAKEYINVLRDNSPEARILAERGVIGQIDSTIDIHDFLKQAGREKTTPNMLDKMLHKVMQMHEASDASTRVAIYKKEYETAIKKGMAPEMAKNLAVHKARESINFAARGNSPTLNALRHMVPFLSASITSLDTVYRAMTGKNLPPEERAEAMKTFYTRAAVMMAATVAYAMAYQDDKDYKKLPDRVKDNNWLIPNPMGDGHSFIKIPVPFEIGFLLKTIPEASVRYMNNTSTGREVLASYAHGLASNLPGGSVPPLGFIPQAIKPALETLVNYSFYTGRPIEGMGDQGKPVEARGAHASELARILSSYGLKNIGLSPAKIDYLIQGYMAELGTFTTGVISSAIASAEGKTAPAKNIEEIPGVKAFMTNPNVSKAIADFYDLEHNSQQVYTYFNSLKKEGKIAEAKRYISDEDTKALLKVEPTLRKIGMQMANINRQINYYKDRQDMDPEARRVKINELQGKLHEVASQGYKVAELAGIKR